MPKHGKRYKDQLAKIDRSKLHTPMEGLQLVKDIAAAKFDETPVRLTRTFVAPSRCRTARARACA